jgi:ABC-type multidrug transport system ATPase subunit
MGISDASDEIDKKCIIERDELKKSKKKEDLFDVHPNHQDSNEIDKICIIERDELEKSKKNEDLFDVHPNHQDSNEIDKICIIERDELEKSKKKEDLFDVHPNHQDSNEIDKKCIIERDELEKSIAQKKEELSQVQKLLADTHLQFNNAKKDIQYGIDPFTALFSKFVMNKKLKITVLVKT